MPSLQLRCSSCKIATACPDRGASPLVLRGGRTAVLCKVVGGYSRDPIDVASLSPESQERASKDGPCLSLAEVPRVDKDSGHVYYETVKVFHHPIRHPREKSTVRLMDSMLPSSYKREPSKR